METVGRYRLLGLLARTERGEVWSAQGPGPEPLALELLLAARQASPDERRRLTGRLRALTSLRHPGLLAPLEVGEERGVPWLVAARPAGQTLAERLRMGGALEPEDAVALIRALGESLAACHAQGVLHGDLRPEHVLLAPAEGRAPEPCLGGFGLPLGSAPLEGPFCAPEQGDSSGGDVGHRSDIYGLAALLYAALTGTAPASGPEGRPPPPSRLQPGVPAGLDAACLRGLAPDPQQRTPDVDAFLLDLERAPLASRGGRPGWVLAGTAALVGAGLLLLVAGPRTGEEPSVTPPAGETAVVPTSAPPAESARTLLGQASAKALSKDLAGARTDLDRALALDPGLARAWRERAVVRAAMDDLRGALEDLDRAIELDPGDVDALDQRAVSRDRARDHRGALADLERVLELKPERATAWFNRGNARWALGDVRAGIADFDRAIELDPRLADAWVNRGNARTEVGDIAGALADYQRAIDLGPIPSAHYNRALLYHALGDVARARDDLDRALEIDPAFQPAWAERGLNGWMAGDLRRALADYDRALELKPDDTRALSNRALARRRSGDLEGARADLDRAIELAPDNPLAWVNRAGLRESQGDLPGAVADSQRAVEVGPGVGEAWAGLGMLLERAGDPGRAREALVRALELEPQARWAGQARQALERLQR